MIVNKLKTTGVLNITGPVLQPTHGLSPTALSSLFLISSDMQHFEVRLDVKEFKTDDCCGCLGHRKRNMSMLSKAVFEIVLKKHSP